MEFLSSILPTELDRWNIQNGSISTTQMLLHAGGEASCSIEQTELEYIPKAFQVRARHNANVDWKSPSLYATLDITYTDGTYYQTLIPFNTTSVTASENITSNIAMVESKTYSDLKFTITNTLDTDLILTLYELRPSLDMDDSLYSSIENMLPQLVYAYNDTTINAVSGVDTQVVQLPVAVNQDTNLLLHFTITGQTTGDTLTCTIKIDGDTVKSFPVKQTMVSGEFYFGVPSVLTFVKKGSHIVSAHIKAESSEITVPKEGALIVLDGKGILGGASGEYPHAEVQQAILMAGMYNHFAQDILINNDIPDMHSEICYIPLNMSNLSVNVTMEIVRRGDVIEFSSLDGSIPPIAPWDSELYYTDMYGMHAITSTEYNYSREIREDCTILRTTVDTTKFNPIYTRKIEEVV